MTTLSQNKKIVIAAISIFIVSFSVMVFFLERTGDQFDHGQTDVLHNDDNHTEQIEEQIENEIGPKIANPYIARLKDPGTPFFVTNAEGDFKHISTEFCMLIGADCESIKDASLFDYVNSKDLPDLAANHSKLIQNGQDTEGIGPYRMPQFKDGKEILVILNAYFEVDKDGKVYEIIFEVNDITKQVEQMTDNGENTSDNEGNSSDPSNDFSDDTEYYDNNSDSDDTQDHWIEELYPQIKEIRNDKVRLMVDKVG